MEEERTSALLTKEAGTAAREPDFIPMGNAIRNRYEKGRVSRLAGSEVESSGIVEICLYF